MTKRSDGEAGPRRTHELLWESACRLEQTCYAWSWLSASQQAADVLVRKFGAQPRSLMSAPTKVATAQGEEIWESDAMGRSSYAAMREVIHSDAG